MALAKFMKYITRSSGDLDIVLFQIVKNCGRALVMRIPFQHQTNKSIAIDEHLDVIHPVLSMLPLAHKAYHSWRWKRLSQRFCQCP